MVAKLKKYEKERVYEKVVTKGELSFENVSAKYLSD